MESGRQVARLEFEKDLVAGAMAGLEIYRPSWATTLGSLQAGFPRGFWMREHPLRAPPRRIKLHHKSRYVLHIDETA
jgi:hypothetical protein